MNSLREYIPDLISKKFPLLNIEEIPKKKRCEFKLTYKNKIIWIYLSTIHLIIESNFSYGRIIVNEIIYEQCLDKGKQELIEALNDFYLIIELEDRLKEGFSHE